MTINYEDLRTPTTEDQADQIAIHFHTYQHTDWSACYEVHMLPQSSLNKGGWSTLLNSPLP